jgi:acetyl esterase/lipase
LDWVLFLLAIFNLVSTTMVFTPRIVPRKSIPFAIFFFALPATELAWIWLPLQVMIAALLIWGGALDSSIGLLALAILLVTWPGLAWNVIKAAEARKVLERTLRKGLGNDYREYISIAVRAQFRDRVPFLEWCNPVGFARDGVEVIRGIPYAPGGVRQQLNIYRPRRMPTEPLPVLLQIHGGGLLWGNKDQQAQPLLYTMATRGWIGVSINYRLSPSVGFPTHLEDCKRALCWIRERGAEYGMQPDFVAVTGGSAGGMLTALMGLTGNDPELQKDRPAVDTSLQAVIPFYGVYDLLTRYNQHPNRAIWEEFLGDAVFHESPQDNPELWDLASPISHVHPDAPPFMIIHGEYDSLAVVTEGRLFSEKLAEVASNPVVFAELPGAEHSYDTLRSLRTEYTIDGIHRFLEWVRARAAN